MATSAALVSTFSSSETHGLERKVKICSDEILEYEQIWSPKQSSKCVDWIRNNHFQRICLQFPDEYLEHSEAIAKNLRKRLGSNGSDSDAHSNKKQNVDIYILADTSYGNCCPDEIAAEHVQADSIVHFGNACRSRTTRLPVYYCFPDLPFDHSLFCKQILSHKEIWQNKRLIIYLDIGYHHVLNKEVNANNERLFGKQLTKLNAEKVLIITYCGDYFAVLLPDGTFDLQTITAEDQWANGEEYICIFVGKDNQRLLNLSLSSKAKEWFVYDSTKGCLQQKHPMLADYMRRRNYYVEKCKDAALLGLIVATLTVDGYLKIVEHLQNLAKKRNIRTKLFSVGRITPTKLANFPEIDCFVLIGCPLNNIFESRDFYKPIVSVFEAELALNPAWFLQYPSVYVTDFRELLPGGKHFLQLEKTSTNREEETDVSLITGKLRNEKNVTQNTSQEINNVQWDAKGKTCVACPTKMDVTHSNFSLTEDRSWKGLELDLDGTKPALVERGLRGIPTRYVHD